MTNYVVKFFDQSSNWLHSEEPVESDSEHPDEITKAAHDQISEREGEDMTGHRAAVYNTETGEGVAIPEEVPDKEPERSKVNIDVASEDDPTQPKETDPAPQPVPVVALPAESGSPNVGSDQPAQPNTGTGA